MIIFPSALVVSTKEDPHANSELSCNGDKAAVFFLSSYSKSREKGEISIAWTEDSRRLPEGAPFQWTGNHLCLHPAGVGRLASVTVSDRRPTEALPPTPAPCPPAPSTWGVVAVLGPVGLEVLGDPPQAVWSGSFPVPSFHCLPLTAPARPCSPPWDGFTSPGTPATYSQERSLPPLPGPLAPRMSWVWV